MKKRWLMLLLACALLAAGCGKKKESAEPAAEKAVQKSAEAASEENADDAEKDKAAEADAAEKDAAASADAEKAAEETDTPAGQDRYAAFLAGDGKMTVHTAGIRSDGLEFNQLYSEGETLTLQEVMDKTAEFIPGEWAAEDAKIIPSAAAAEIDCGNDGEKELALCITYPVQSESWRQYMILKDQGEELALCYMGCAWSRSDITMDGDTYTAKVKRRTGRKTAKRALAFSEFRKETERNQHTGVYSRSQNDIQSHSTFSTVSCAVDLRRPEQRLYPEPD